MLPCRFGLKKSKDTIVLIPVVDSRFLFRTHLQVNRFQYNKITLVLQSATIIIWRKKFQITDNYLCKFRMEGTFFL